MFLLIKWDIMHNLKILALLLIFLTLNSTAQSQRYLNLDFEFTKPNDIARDWYQGGDGYEVKVDTTVYYSGKKSMRIKKISEGNSGVTTNYFPVNGAKGKHLRYTGYIRTEGITEGYAGLWWRVDGKIQGKTLGFDNMLNRGAVGTTDWKQYTIEMDIDTAAANINFGVLLLGNGTAWFDNLQIDLDGKVYEQIEPKPFIPSDGQIAWLKENLIQFNTAEPVEDDADLQKLKSVVGDAKLVSLGEGTHGTSEFFKMKHRIVKFLAEKMGFTVFAIEANMPEARRVNDYILYGKGDVKEALAGMYFWTWNTQEVLDMIEWMRQYNTSGKGHIEFCGFDMQFPQVAMNNVQQFITKIEPEYYDSLSIAYNKIREIYKKRMAASYKDFPDSLYRSWYDEARKVYKHLQRKRDEYLKNLEYMTVEEAIQDARIVIQSAEANIRGKSTRDESMAANVEWIVSYSQPGTKIILWAHNGHVSKDVEFYKPMGKYLYEKFENDIFVFGLLFGEGNYTARGQDGLGSYGTSLPEPGSYEDAFRKTGIQRFILDFRNIAYSPFSRWLNEEMNFRSIGAMAMDYAFFRTVLPRQFDAVIYFDKTTPSKLLPFPSEVKR